eukprot:3933539-Rhodomonas_salina.3
MSGLCWYRTPHSERSFIGAGHRAAKAQHDRDHCLRQYGTAHSKEYRTSHSDGVGRYPGLLEPRATAQRLVRGCAISVPGMA